ncbi:MAG: polysaccharide biosynthesis tyrosine autokinase [Pseudomonadota bacterium]
MSTVEPTNSPDLFYNNSKSLPEKSIRDVFYMLWRRKWLISGFVFACTLLCVIFLQSVTPRYKSKTLLTMESRGTNVVNIEAVTSALPGDESTFNSEIEIVKSRNLAKRVISHLELDKLPEFNPELEEKGFLAKLLSGDDAATLRTPQDDESIGLPTEVADYSVIPIATVERYLNRLNVTSTGIASRVMEISFSSQDPRLSALVANTIAFYYLESQREIKAKSLQQANDWLNEQLVELRENVVQSERMVEEFRRDAGLLQGSDGTFTAEYTSQLNSQLVLAKTATAEADARYRQIRQLAGSTDGLASASQVLDSPNVQSLRQQEAELERREAELSIEYGALHPKMIQLNAEKADLKSLIKLELDKIVKNYRNKANVARARETALTNALEEMQQKVGQENTAEVGLRALEREAKANQLILESFLARYKETSLQEELGAFEQDSKVISHADVPVKPAFPRKGVTLALVIICSSLVAVLIAFLLESLDVGLRSSVQIEYLTNLPCLGMVPKLKSSTTSAKGGMAAQEDYEALRESIRSLRSGIDLSGSNPNSKTILITSSVPGEGKTFIALCLARFFPKGGRGAIVIDTDMRRPRVHTVFGTERERGLSELLQGKITLEQAIQKDQTSGASFITAGSPVPDPTSLLASKEFEDYIEPLNEAYDIVILDSPPLMAVSDARYLSRIADKTVMVVRWSKTKRDVVMMSLQQLASVSDSTCGTLLSMVDVQKHAGYGYRDSGVYTGELKKYYTT